MAVVTKRKYRHHEPIPIPNKWSGDERRFGVKLEETLDDIYQRFGTGDEVNARTAERLLNARTISLVGETLGAGQFDGSKDLSIFTTVERLTNEELEGMLT